MTTFTNDELNKVADAARRVWSEIAFDVCSECGDIPKAEVVELVLDASRLEGELKRMKASPEFLARVETDVYGKSSAIERYLKRHVFTFARYGL